MQINGFVMAYMTKKKYAVKLLFGGHLEEIHKVAVEGSRLLEDILMLHLLVNMFIRTF